MSLAAPLSREAFPNVRRGVDHDGARAHPIAAAARHVFALRTAMPSSWESFGALSALTEILVAGLQAKYWGEAKRRMERLEKIRSRLESGGRRG